MFTTANRAAMVAAPSAPMLAHHRLCSRSARVQTAATNGEKTRDYLKTFPAHIETALHQSLHDERFRFVNIAQWTSEADFDAAIRSRGFREAASELHWPMNPALYRVVRTG
jgi:hypothetical protein